MYIRCGLTVSGVSELYQQYESSSTHSSAEVIFRGTLTGQYDVFFFGRKSLQRFLHATQPLHWLGTPRKW